MLIKLLIINFLIKLYAHKSIFQEIQLIIILITKRVDMTFYTGALPLSFQRVGSIGCTVKV